MRDGNNCGIFAFFNAYALLHHDINMKNLVHTEIEKIRLWLMFNIGKLTRPTYRKRVDSRLETVHMVTKVVYGDVIRRIEGDKGVYQRIAEFVENRSHDMVFEKDQDAKKETAVKVKFVSDSPPNKDDIGNERKKVCRVHCKEKVDKKSRRRRNAATIDVEVVSEEVNGMFIYCPVFKPFASYSIP